MYCCKWPFENASGAMSSQVFSRLLMVLSCLQGDWRWASFTDIIILTFISGFALTRKQELTITAYACSSSWRELRLDVYGMFSTRTGHANETSSGFFQTRMYDASRWFRKLSACV